jgi:glycine/D-amino acid oxidase-like deaminating enzyme
VGHRRARSGRGTRAAPGAVALHLEDLGNPTPVVFFNREANLAWELEFEGGHEIVERREAGVVVLYTTPSSEQTTLWRVDL